MEIPRSALAGLFPDPVVTRGAAPDSLTGDLYPEEWEVVEHALEKRQVEFRAGRLLARRALPDVGAEPGPVLADGRRPIWPPGILGSISHTRGFCAVALARRGGIRGVGVDIEQAGVVEERLFRRILGPEETEWVAGRGEPERWGTVLFSAKESFYKCLADVHPHFVGFHDVRIVADAEACTFDVIPLADPVVDVLAGRTVTGRFREVGAWVMTGATLRDGASG